MTDQPCAGCGQETRPGSARFVGRRTGVDPETGEQVVVCLSCVADRAVHRDRASDARLDTIVLGDTFNG